MEREALLAAAREAALRAYARYSRFRVGAAVVVRTPNGERVVTGANVENASYGLTICAERVALAAACALTPPPPDTPEEARTFPRPDITQVAVACIDAAAQGSYCMPCGACRQWLAELAPDAVYYVDGMPGELRLDDLLPHAFRL